MLLWIRLIHLCSLHKFKDEVALQPEILLNRIHLTFNERGKPSYGQLMELVSDLVKTYIDHGISYIDFPFRSGLLDLMTLKIPLGRGGNMGSAAISVQLQATADGLQFVNSIDALQAIMDADRDYYMSLARGSIGENTRG
jgi:hypothetical protein